MNYGKKNISRRQREITSKAAMKKKRNGVRLFKSMLIFLLIIGIAGIIGAGLLFKQIIDEAPKITADDVKPSAYTTVAYADDGKTVLDTFVDAGSNRVYTSIEEIPEYMQNAVIAIEDSRFREHDGIDPKGIARAAVKGVTSGNFSEGASTITQQLIKNSIFPNFNQETTLESIKRKIQEQYLALQLEKELEKEYGKQEGKNQILENYLNTINLGQNTLGVQAASKRYFGKDVSDLTLSECATIAAITQNPTRFNPITNPENNAERREKVLNDMLEQGLITEKEHKKAMKDSVYDRIQTANTEYIGSLSVSSYFIDAVAKQVIRDLQNELGYTETQAYNAVYSGGLSIITTQNAEMQKICEDEMNNSANYPYKVDWGITCAITITHPDGTQNHYDHNGLKNYMYEKHNDNYGLTQSSKEKCERYIEEYIDSLTKKGDKVDKRVVISPQPQASVVIIDQETGHVKAMVGGRGEKTSDQSLNRATQSYRQPGSCFKVLSTFVPALDTHGDTLATVIKDAPFKYDTGRPVNNHWSGYKGNMTIRKCIEQSANVCTVKKFTEITPALGYKYLTENFAFSTLPPEDAVQAACLGGIANGVYNIEMTAAFAAIANGGTYTEPIMYTQILDHSGNLLFEKTPDTHTAMKETTAALITSAMEDVVTKGTGKAVKLSNMPVAAKTGTTTNNVDFWLSGYTPYLTCSVWGGYDDNKPMDSLSFHKTIWRKIMSRIHEDYEEKDFDMPNSIERKTICKDTGKLASSKYCTRYTEYFAPGTAPKQSCSGHVDKKKEEEEKKKQEAAANADNADGSDADTSQNGATQDDSGNGGTITGQ